MALGNFAAGFLGAFTAAKQQKQQRELDEQLRKAQVKLIDLQLQQQQQAQKENQAKTAQQAQQRSAMDDVFSRMNGGSPLQSNPAITLGDPRPKMSLAEMLADSQMQGQLLQSGLMKPEDMLKLVAPEPTTNQKDYKYYVGQETAAGRQPLSFNQWDLQARKAGASNNTLVAGDPKYGKIPEGFMLTVTPEGPKITQIPGAPPTTQQADIQKLSREAQLAFQTYRSALEGLKTNLSETVTGPLIGKLPAITSSQQKAAGGVAAMAPVLKQLFRAAGEGTFTDRDQALLLDMIPTRETLPEARQALLDNIDSIVRAKLGMLPAGIPPGSVVIGTSQGRPVYQTPDGKRLVVE